MSIHALENLTVCRPCSFTLLSKITLAYADNSVNPDHGGVPYDENQRVAADGRREGRKFTVSASAKLLLCAVMESADAFPPLKSVAGGLCSTLENCEAGFTSHKLLRRDAYNFSSEHRKTHRR